jgi:hypothetical protein
MYDCNMSAFRRRTRFATPVILVAACSSSKEPTKAKQFPGVTWSVRMLVDMKCVATRADDQRSIECPPGMSGTTVFTVGELANKTCAIVPAGCVEERCVKIASPCPLPKGQQATQKLAVVWTIEKLGDECHAEEGEGHDACPPGIDCNPPQPRIVQCPPGVTEERELRIAELLDGTCVIVPDGCETTGCATQRIDCPKQVPRK